MARRKKEYHIVPRSLIARRRMRSMHSGGRGVLAELQNALRVESPRHLVRPNSVLPAASSSVTERRPSTPVVVDQQEVPVATPLRARQSTSRRGHVYDFQNEESPIRPIIRAGHAGPKSFENVVPGRISGSRVVKLQQFLDQIRSDRHPGGLDCSFLDTDFVKEVRKGFQSKLYFKCRMCQKETVLDTNLSQENELSLNDAMVTGALGGGGGFATLSELCAAVDMPCMAQSTYILLERKVGRVIEEAALESMLEAGREERRLALEAGDVAADGTPQIRVLADGMWSKRSYKNKYNALSGTASIVGWRTQKVLFTGARNKHCFLCVFAESRGREPREHECAQNWQGSSTGMETSIICEGFHASEEMHGVRYHQLVADGDASVYARLTETMPYGPLEMVEKIECKNHLLRNFRSSILELAANTKLTFPAGPGGKAAMAAGKKELVTLRRLIKSNVRRLSNAMDKACKKRANEAGTLQERTERLRKDILNAGSHVFGQHTLCDEYFCRTVQAAQAQPSTPRSEAAPPATPTAPEENFVPRLEKCGLWTEIMKSLNKMAHHASSLIHNVNTNICEVANSVLAKYIAGKRMFYSGRHSFNARCSAATLSLNTEGQFHRNVQKKLQNGKSPGFFTSKHNKKRVKRLHQARQRRLDFQNTSPSRQQQRTRRCVRRVAGPDKNYGLGVHPLDSDEEPEDEPFEQLQAKMQAVVDSLHAALKDWDTTMRNIPQNSSKWKSLRRMRLTACNFGEVCRRKAHTSCKKMVCRLLYSKPDDLKATDPRKHGHDNEERAREALANELGVKLTTCGLQVDKKNPFLGASIDAHIDDDTIAELKCPVKAGEYDSIEKAIAGKTLPYLNIDKNGHITLKETDKYFYQVQGQLHITCATICIFYIYTKNWTHQILITRNDEFWATEMEPKLVRFYMTCILPELASSRYRIRNCDEDIREPQHILDAMEEHKKQQQREKEKQRERQLRAANTRSTSTANQRPVLRRHSR